MKNPIKKFLDWLLVEHIAYIDRQNPEVTRQVNEMIIAEYGSIDNYAEAVGNTPAMNKVIGIMRSREKVEE